MPTAEWLSQCVFQFIHRHNLVYNTCWEDPRLDRAALRLGPEDRVLVITSAGCNALDYVLAGAGEVIAVDINPRQNALLELKLAGIRGLAYPDFFSMFGRGRVDNAGRIYAERLRSWLSPPARAYWDRRIGLFEPGNLRPFYYRGTSGTFALAMSLYMKRVARLRPWLDALLAAASLDEQRQIYERMHDRFWSRGARFFMRRDFVLAMLGVPPQQRRQVEADYPGGIVQFVHDCVEAVFSRLPLADNYFWRVYLTGTYTRDCCPEYLKAENFVALKAGLVDRVQVHTDTVHGFLEKHDLPISRFVLLDHMDWLSGDLGPCLDAEWQWIVRRAAPGARAIWRSGGLRTDFVDRARIVVGGRYREVGELLRYDRPLAESLHAKCRVHTYGSFHIADLTA